MNPLRTLLTAPSTQPFAIIRCGNADHLRVFTGDVVTVDRLADIPLPTGPGPRTLALVPYRQVAERGFACVDDGTPLDCLRITATATVGLPAAVAALPDTPIRATAGHFDIDDEEYGQAVAAVLRDEIGRGAGANFVLHRTFRASVAGDPVTAGLAAFRRLLLGERGAYWTFLVHTGDRTLVGATPERHVSVADGLVTMNPISGTLRHVGGPADVGELLRFLADPKETDELYMVLDEELKMMAAVADQGGQVVGPYLKQMAYLTHTEYLLAGRTSRDVREVLRETMFAPTVTGSPIENACRVIARHERRGRGYYAGVLALLGHDDAGRQTLDAPILIRTAELNAAGELRVPVGATLVRHSTPGAEVAETHAKAAGVLTALGLRTVTGRSRPDAAGPNAAGPDSAAVPGDPGDHPRVQAALAARNADLAGFWLHQCRPGDLAVPSLAGRQAVIVDGEDTFTGMLAHQLQALGMSVAVRPWHSPGPLAEADLVVAGPGPGDPGDDTDPKIDVLRRVVAERVDHRHPLLAVCLGHQVLARLLGLPLHRRTEPYQGVARDVDLFGVRRRVGFYSTFTARAAVDTFDGPTGPVRLARDPSDGSVHALAGPTFAGVQFHPESVLSRDGLAVLTDLVTALLGTLVRTG